MKTRPSILKNIMYFYPADISLETPEYLQWLLFLG